MSVPDAILKTIHELKPLSQSAMHLLKVVGEPEHNFHQITRIVQNDPVLTAGILRMVNSAAFGLQTKIDSISRAVPFLGEKVVVGISLGLCASQMYNSALDGYASPEGQLWGHSLFVAIASQELSRYAKTAVNPETAFTAGLLHDIGKTVISAYLTGKTLQLVEDVGQNGQMDFLQAEHNRIGTDHCEVGKAVAEFWNLPDNLIAAISCHHQPHLAPEAEKAMVYAVHVGDFIAMMHGIGTGADTLQYKLDEGYRPYLNVTIHDIERIFFDASREYEKTMGTMNGEKEGSA